MKHMRYLLYSMKACWFFKIIMLWMQNESTWPFAALNTTNQFSSVVTPCTHFIMHTFHSILMSSLEEEKDLCQAGNDICISLNGVVRCCKSTALDLQDLCQSPIFTGSEAQRVLNHMKMEHWEHEHVLRSRHAEHGTIIQRPFMGVYNISINNNSVCSLVA